MGLIGKPVALLDVANTEAFVQRCIDKSQIRYDALEREELLAEGLTILYELAAKYNPGVGGRDATQSRFSGYAAMFLPRRLGDVWHKSHPEHLYITDPDTGKRGWFYGPPMVSLDALADNPSNPDRGEHHLRFAKRIGDFVSTASLCLPSQRIQSA